ncbi:P2Y purinoceptor 6 [Hypomesus transpacificus]|uniref:P2Y purinoceptor 6 n=1 Tax=Hypomesus transpacificus TaxID=137520 RepID=UPI001F083F3C|nr:P2Y purinoceptor 6 [Hypomesus transpacificus]
MNVSTGNISTISMSYGNLNYFMDVTKLLFTICYSLNLTLGLPTNIYVVKLILTGAAGQMASEFFALNLAVNESLYCLLNILGLLDFHYFMGSFYHARVLSTGFICTSRPLFQCCICFERFLAVVYPVVFLKYKPLRYRMVCSGFMYMWIIGSCCLAMYMSFSNTFFYYYMSQYLVVFVVQLFCCLSVLKALKGPGPGDGDREREGSNSMKRKAFSIILIILLSFVINCLPIAVIVPLQSYLRPDDFYLVLSVCFATIVLTGFVQPVIYLHRAGKLPCIRRL